MMNDMHKLRGIFSKNRAEELGYDVWQHFVVPPFYDRLDLKSARKPSLIIGGRGCGKTMLLRYLCHQSTFSPNRPHVPDDAASHIGLYWRADTQFVNAMIKRGVAEDTWHSAFSHMAAIVLAMEILKSLESMARSKWPHLSPQDLVKVSFRRLQAFESDVPDSVEAFYAFLENRVWQLQAWVSDVRKAQEPRFLPGDKFLLAMISEIKAQLPPFREAIYFVYLDEYENLCEYQKRIVNTWLKHSESPLIFNLAMKRNAFDVRGTTGPESLADIQDFRTHDLEAYLEKHFEAFAAEILFLHLSMASQEQYPTSQVDLHDPRQLTDRSKPDYIRTVISAADNIFPGVSHRDLAAELFKDDALVSKLRRRIEAALGERVHDVAAERYFRSSLPEATIVVPALLHRKNLRAEEIVLELDKLERGEANDFTGTRNWIHNNFVGCLLQLYEPHSRACAFYAGFRTFCLLSHVNVRYFLELCHKSISRIDPELLQFPISPPDQAEAAREASAAFLREVRSFGPRGLQLYTFALRLGSLFALAHKRPAQSESEQAHFAVGPGTEQLTSDDHAFLREAVKYSVLYEEEETKKKDVADPEGVQYVFSPIYAPYFHISYRKKKKLELTSNDLVVLIRGTYDEVKDLLRRYSTSWAIGAEDMTPTLFSHLLREGE